MFYERNNLFGEFCQKQQDYDKIAVHYSISFFMMPMTLKAYRCSNRHTGLINQFIASPFYFFNLLKLDPLLS